MRWLTWPYCSHRWRALSLLSWGEEGDEEEHRGRGSMEESRGVVTEMRTHRSVTKRKVNSFWLSFNHNSLQHCKINHRKSLLEEYACKITSTVRWWLTVPTQCRLSSATSFGHSCLLFSSFWSLPRAHDRRRWLEHRFFHGQNKNCIVFLWSEV